MLRCWVRFHISTPTSKFYLPMHSPDSLSLFVSPFIFWLLALTNYPSLTESPQAGLSKSVPFLLVLSFGAWQVCFSHQVPVLFTDTSMTALGNSPNSYIVPKACLSPVPLCWPCPSATQELLFWCWTLNQKSWQSLFLGSFLKCEEGRTLNYTVYIKVSSESLWAMVKPSVDMCCLRSLHSLSIPYL
jgi:hypothetical protein